MTYVGKSPADIIATAVDTTTGTFSGDLTVDTNTLYVDSANNRVGIGTTVPSRKLSIYDATTPYMALYDGSSGTTVTDGFQVQFASGNAYLWNYENGFTAFGTNANERMRIDSSGRVMIGTTIEGDSSADDLTVAGSANTGITIRAGASNSSSIYMSDDTSGAGEYAGYIAYSHSSNSMSFGVSSGQKVIIDSSGNVGIGTSSPASIGSGRVSLNVNGTTDSFVFVGANSTNTGFLQGASSFAALVGSSVPLLLQSTGANNIQFSTNGSERMRIDSNGNLLVGATSSNAGAFGAISPQILVAGTIPQVALHETDTDKDGYIGISSSTMFIQTADAIPIRFGTSDTERMRIASDGKVTLTQQVAAKAPSFRAYMGAGQTVTTNTVTVGAFNTEVWDSNSNYDTSTYRFTPTVAGYYHFTVQVFASVSTNRAMVGFRKNGSSNTETFHAGSAAGGGICYQSDALIDLNGSSDYVEAVFYHEQGSNVTCNNNIALTNFAGHLLMAT